MTKSFTLLLILGIFCLGACRLPSEDLTPEESDLLDTLYANRIKDLRPILDSTCIARQDSLRQRAVDSLVELQLIEIKKLTDRR